MAGNPELYTFSVSLMRRIPAILLNTECPEAHIVDNDRMPESVANPFKHLHFPKALRFHSFLVKQGVSHEIVFISSSIIILIDIRQNVLCFRVRWSISLTFKIERSKPNNREGRKCNIEELINNLLIQWLPREAGVETEVELGDNIQEILVETI